MKRFNQDKGVYLRLIGNVSAPKFLSLLLLCSLTWGVALSIPQPVYAQNAIQRFWRRFTSRPDPNSRPETVSKGGANRDRCPFADKALTAVVPISEEGISYLEQTSVAYPTWYFYVPYPPSLNRQVEFALLNTDEEIIYQTIVPLQNSPGVLSISLPTSERALEIDQTYRWVFSVICNPSNRSGDATVNGWVKRVEISQLEAELSRYDAQEQYVVYFENLLWFDAIDELFKLQEKNPELTDAQNVLSYLGEELEIEELSNPSSLND